MVKRIDYLNPRRTLVDETVDWLCGAQGRAGCIRKTPEGAWSLAHIMVIVPTAQSGRNLRLALARKAALLGRDGLLPPRIAMSNALLVPNGIRIATETEELAVMAETLRTFDLRSVSALFPKPPAQPTVDWALALAASILDIHAILGARALEMSDVVCDEDGARWKDLAQIEAAFFAALEQHGVMPRVRARKAAAANGCVEEGVEEIVLPGAVDVSGAVETYLTHSPQTVTLLIHADAQDADGFDAWGRPVRFFSSLVDPSTVHPAPTAVVEADDIAKFFRAVDPAEALPALAVCDADMYPELEGAFQNHFAEDELVLRNPSQEQVAQSPLGRLFVAVYELAQRRDYETFSTFIRSGDVARWAAVALDASPAEVAMCVGALDAVQNAHLPRTIGEVIAGAETEAGRAWQERDRQAAVGLKRLAETVDAALADPFAFLKKIFATLTLDEKNPSDRELVAAAETVRELRADCMSDVIPEMFRQRLFVERLKTAAYMLEPTAPNVLPAIGWLEVPWCAEDELVIAGFNEGCVPENVVGHPFVPNRLREQLGLSTNDGRAMRDAFIFAQAVACRAPGAVRVHLHQIDGDKNVMKPSRILFHGISDDALPGLARRLYAVTKGNDGAPPKDLPPAWRLALPFPPQETTFRERISVTALDQYRRCPFNFFLQETFGEHADDRNQELDAQTFGTLCHAALDDFAQHGPKDSTDADEIAAFLERAVRGRLAEFGTNLPVIIDLQGEAAIVRLRTFAALQAARRKAGWRIVASEQNLSCTIKGCPTRIRGKVDRIDEHEVTKELAIIDYKTWNRASADKYDSLQLPLYRAMVEASNQYDAARAQTSKAFYCILAERAEDTKFDEAHVCDAGTQSAREDEAVALLTALAKGIFYPPTRNSNWATTYGTLVWESPERGLDPAWLADQAARREANA